MSQQPGISLGHASCLGGHLIGVESGSSALTANAAFNSLASTAAITFVNNKGDVGKTLREMGSSQFVRTTIAAALTAGVLDKLGATSTMKDLSSKTGFSEKLTYNLINASGRALTNTAINGGNLEDALKAALVGGLVDTVHGQVASQIKGLEADYLAHKLAHALAGGGVKSEVRCARPPRRSASQHQQGARPDTAPALGRPAGGMPRLLSVLRHQQWHAPTCCRGMPPAGHPG